MAHGCAVARTQIEHGIALGGQQVGRVTLGSEHAGAQFGTVRVPSSVFLSRKSAKRFPVDRLSGNGVQGPQGSTLQANGWRKVLRATLAALLSSTHDLNPSASRRWLLVGFPQRLHAGLNLGDLGFTPSLTFKGVDFGGDADFPSQHTGNFPTHPSR